MDCTNIKKESSSSRYGNRGCSGGFVDDSLKFMSENTVFDAKSLPYKGNEGKCR